MNIAIAITIIHIILVLLVFVFFLWISSAKIKRTLEEGKKNYWKRMFLRAAIFPIKFLGDFFRSEKKSRLPFYLRWFNIFTRFCSRIPYFHFLPKFLVATSCEFSVNFFTGHELLTGVIFAWSFSFFAIITFMESKLGELEEDSITLANKIFLRISIAVTLAAIAFGRIFWDEAGHFFDNAFWRFIAEISIFFNHWLVVGWFKFWSLPPFVISSTFILLIIFIGVSLASSRK